MNIPEYLPGLKSGVQGYLHLEIPGQSTSPNMGWQKQFALESLKRNDNWLSAKWQKITFSQKTIKL